MKTNKKIIYFGITLLAVIIILLTVYFTFFKCSVPYNVSCHYPKSEEIKVDILHFISCTSDKDCSVENMNSFCSPGFPNLLKCGSSKYYCDNGLCKGCDCIGPSYDIDKRPDGINENHKEENNLKTKCCEECKIAFSKSPIGVGPEMATCGNFGSGQPVSTNCNLFFKNNPMSVSACESYIKIKPSEYVYPKTTGITYFDDWKLINNTDSFLIKTIKPLTEEQIYILRNLGIRKLSASEIENIYHSLIEEYKIKEVEDLDFVDYIHPYLIK
ncbi:MAG: hypothetical protein ACT6FE_01060 [Methanosarcinaceae archaeon]